MPTVKSALSGSGFLLHSKVVYPSSHIRVKVRSDIFWHKLQLGEWEPRPIQLILKTVKEGDNILDIGAMNGPYTLLLSKLVGSEGRVYAFEPDPRARSILLQNLAANDSTNVCVEALCVSNARGKVVLSEPSDLGGSTILQHLGGKTSAQIMVDATTIDHYCEEKGIAPVGMKIDVEGAEAMVLEGAEEVIKRHSPWILLEYHGVFMSEKENELNWKRVTKYARRMIFVAGDSKSCSQGDEIVAMTDCSYFHVLLEH